LLVPRVPPIPPIYPIPADRPTPRPENSPEDIEDRKQRRCGTHALPVTLVTFSPGWLGQGKRVKASPLTLCPGNTRGSKPLESIYREQFECIRTAGESGNWVRGHLLHGKTDRTGDRHLHGPGDTSANLIIISQSLNQSMRSWIEDAALKLVYGPLPHVLWMDVWVDSYHRGLDFFAESINVEYGPFRTSTGTEGAAWNRKQFADPRKPPPCPAVPRPPPGIRGTSGFQSTVSIWGGGRGNQLVSRNVEIDKTTGGLSVALDVQLAPAKCTVERYYVELVKDVSWKGNPKISQTRVYVYPDVRRQLLVWRELPPGEYYLRIWREDEGVLKRTPGCLLKGDITVDTFHAPAHDPPLYPMEMARIQPSVTATGRGERMG
jgi:hypothetical protein